MDFLIDPYRYRATLTLTSRPYPQEVVESLDMSAWIVRAGGLSPPVEGINFSADFISAFMPVVVGYKSGFSTEGFDVSAQVVLCDLTVAAAYKYGYATESMDMTADVLEAAMVRVNGYVGNTVQPENLDMTADVVASFMG